MWPTAEDVARVIVACAKEEGECPLEVANGVHGLRSRMFAFLILAVEFPDAPRGWRPSIRTLIGAHFGFEGAVRLKIRAGKGFDLERLNSVRERLGLRRVTQEECLEATYEPHPKRASRRKAASKSAAAALTDAEIEAIPGESFPMRQRATELAMLRRAHALTAEQLAFTDLNRIPSREEQLAGHELIIVRRDDEPSFERSALAERLRAPKAPLKGAPEIKDGITLFTEGYNCGLHGDDETFPETLIGMGAEYRTGWQTGFADRHLLKASQEEFDKAMEQA